jgi:hypothetical protein
MSLVSKIEGRITKIFHDGNWLLFFFNLFYESGIPDLSVPRPEGKVHVPYPNTPSRRPPRAQRQDSRSSVAKTSFATFHPLSEAKETFL